MQIQASPPPAPHSRLQMRRQPRAQTPPARPSARDHGRRPWIACGRCGMPRWDLHDVFVLPARHRGGKQPARLHCLRRASSQPQRRGAPAEAVSVASAAARRRERATRADGRVSRACLPGGHLPRRRARARGQDRKRSACFGLDRRHRAPRARAHRHRRRQRR